MINTFMRGIYEEEVFLESAAAARLSKCLYTFIKAYLFLAHSSVQEGRPYLFALYPKLHWIHEIGHELKRQSHLASFVVNPAIHCCALDEDFIGRAAAPTRSVSPKVIAKRTLERYLAQLQISWARA